MTNLFSNLPQNLDTESVDVLLSNPRLRVERIVSHGQASPPGFWYDQEWSEWVIVLQGKAQLRFENEPEARELKSGDYVLIAAHRKHRVESTDASVPTVWLAVHFD